MTCRFAVCGLRFAALWFAVLNLRFDAFACVQMRTQAKRHNAVALRLLLNPKPSIRPQSGANPNISTLTQNSKPQTLNHKLQT